MTKYTAGDRATVTATGLTGTVDRVETVNGMPFQIVYLEIDGAIAPYQSSALRKA